jgi:pilus assembly protein Flp/PilA
MIRQFLQDDSAATAIEYGLIASLISVAIIAAVSLLGDSLDESFTETASKVSGSVN